MQPRENLGRHGIDAVEDRGGPGIGGPHLPLLGVGERERTQREDLVDLGRVVQIARALRCDLRMVVEDDRRREQDVSGADLAGQHGEGVHVAAFLRRVRRPLGRVEQ
ncbi:hypothetical protein ABZ793_23480 [Micromonospora sp. NPDC047465]|uniref:hypothetical protein n=1 Tax=Micromonospora sp. NPDC047465 TaxID=3154813 RepID=UPI0033E137CA